MAFHQPTRQLTQRIIRVETDSLESQTPVPPISQTRDESQTWVLFSPATDAGTTTSYLSSVQDSQPTPGRSRLSDLGSLNTVARSDLDSRHVSSVVASDVLDDDVIEDDAELDSLDSHLPDFRAVPNDHSHGFSQSIPILPTHDGLGSFRLDNQAMGSEMQDRIYAFEQFNPRRVKRRRESLELAQLEIEREQVQEIERTKRIEEWRLDQSRVLLEEIQRETRRRRQSHVSTQKLGSAMSPAEDAATMSTVGEATPETSLAGSDWHDQDGEEAARSRDGLWSRFTRRVIEDLMGIDDKTLSILFGEALPDDIDDLSSTPKASTGSGSHVTMRGEVESFRDSSWQLRMLDRIARELGMLVHHLSSHPHPGAFSTYVRMQQTPLPYAGLPVIPEAAVDAADSPAKNVVDSTPTMPQFKPTVGQTQPMNIPGSRTAESALETTPSAVGDDASAAFTQQEWEQELDIKLVFRYLRSRFTNRSSSSGPYTSGASHLATSSAQDVAAKAARVRQHHPLVSRARQAERRTFKVTAPASPTAMRHASSCASQSTRRSGRRGSLSVSSRHSSRHYWDIGGSIGTGSLIASTGPMGSWGEV